ncbi:hypothetical protein THAOC_05812 [Thalassiosira oceanica]|uniref:Uncharacterized protein n=1 Tax=Thalassiosira oceanica TaxID=159749 RepID=K0TME6_THAOC|nr:hypothetical protein THAOC_05812 [Thalassiosira oceanica]|eukprot:EJK72637.1 hypothetical protein THAOC_05812 [Thalassiosira oceanica]
MDSINAAKKRKAASGASDPPRAGNGDSDTVVPANFSLADLNRLIDQRTEDLKAETLALSLRVDGLQRENEGLLLRCESPERSVQVLTREIKWTYLAPDVPRSHWLEQGYDEEDAEEAKNLIQYINENTYGMATVSSNVSFMSSFREGITTYSPVKRLFCGFGTDTLQYVNLADNGIKTNGDTCIPDFLSANPPLERLMLWGNRLTDDDALNIAVALQSNTYLRYLDLENNALTEEGKGVMYHQAILGISPSDLSTLKSVSEANLNTVSGANHTCEIIGIYNSKYFVNTISKSSKSNRGRKLFWLLANRCKEGCNMTQLESEFLEDSIGLVPYVLACANIYATDNESNSNLSLLFELARDWKTPELYQFHRAWLWH